MRISFPTVQHGAAFLHSAQQTCVDLNKKSIWSSCKRPENAPMTPDALTASDPTVGNTVLRRRLLMLSTWLRGIHSGRVLSGGWLYWRSCAVRPVQAWMRSGELARPAQLTAWEEQILRIIGLSIEG
ncbi:hypothetical protein [Streptomyces fagopyri]|uniref:hypothetical protein n=1 Tax=Streptomyces fagopyri TaxID=2662397 RepID=UPI0033E61A96